MVIQRIQSLFLLLACVLMALVCFIVPVASLGEGLPVFVYNILPLLVLDALIALLLLVDIFLFKVLKLQMTVARVSTVLICCSILIELWMAYVQIDGDPMCLGSILMLAAALVLTLLAYNGMKKDHKLLRSYNTLR